MSLVLLEVVERFGRPAKAPRLRVQCSICKRIYITAQYQNQLRKHKVGCMSCAQSIRQQLARGAA